MNLFASHEDAMRNGALPETDALATQAMQFADASFHDCDVLQDAWRDELQAQSIKLVEMFVTAEVPDDLFTDDVVVEVNVPHGRQIYEGIERVTSSVPTVVSQVASRTRNSFPRSGASSSRSACERTRTPVRCASLGPRVG